MRVFSTRDESEIEAAIKETIAIATRNRKIWRCIINDTMVSVNPYGMIRFTLNGVDHRHDVAFPIDYQKAIDALAENAQDTQEESAMNLDTAILIEDALDCMPKMNRADFIGCVKPEHRESNAAAWDKAAEFVARLGSVQKAKNAIEQEIEKARRAFFPA